MTIAHRLTVMSLTLSAFASLPLLGSAQYGPTRPAPPPKEARLIGTHVGGVAAAHFSPDGKLLASGGGDRMIRLWDVAAAKQVREFNGPTGFTCTVRFSPDGKLLAASGYESGSSSGLIYLYDPSGKELKSLAGHPNGVRRVVFTPDSKRLLSAGFDGTIRVWDLATGKEKSQIKAAAGATIYSLALCPEAKCVATASESTKLFDLASGKELTRSDLSRTRSTAVAFSQDGKLLATGDGNKVILWEVATGRVVRELGGYRGEISFLTFSTNSRTLFSASYDRTVRAWDVRTGRQIREFEGHTSWVWGLALSPDERLAASASSDGKLLAWDLSSFSGPSDKAARLTPKQLEEKYSALGSDDAGRAYEAVRALSSNPANSLPFIQKQLAKMRLPGDYNPARIARLIADLDASDFETRERASAELEKASALAVPALQTALLTPPSLEARRRMERLMSRCDPCAFSAEDLIAVRAVQVLEEIGSGEAKKALEALARTGSNVRLVDEASRASSRLARPTRGRTTAP